MAKIFKNPQMRRKSFRKKFGYRKGYTYIYTMINELLERRDILNEIAIELYGELWVTEDSFWGSPTELEMREIQEQLNDLGWEEEAPTDEQIALADMLFEELKRKGKIS